MWEEIIEKINYDNPPSDKIEKDYFNIERPNIEVVNNTLLLRDQTWYPPKIQKVIDELKEKYNYKCIHMFISFVPNPSFGGHCDQDDVLLYQLLGEMSYEYGNGRTREKITLKPGDTLHLPAGTYHRPIATKARVTLSMEV